MAKKNRRRNKRALNPAPLLHASGDFVSTTELNSEILSHELKLSPTECFFSGRTYWIVLGLITLVAVVVRLWGIERFSKLVFDEVYFAQFGFNYLTSTTFFDAHPPLSKYLIGMGIWLYNVMPFTETLVLKDVQITELSPVAWRWLNAVSGIVLVPVAARALYALWQNHSASLLMALFVALEGMLIVESRFGLNNVYIALFGLSALYFFGRASYSETKTHQFLILCSAMLGFTYGIKWNGLGFSAVVWGACLLAFAIQFRQQQLGLFSSKYRTTRFSQVSRVHPLDLFLIIIFVGFTLYSLLWIPHVTMMPEYGFFEVQKQILGYHSGGVASDAHPYCASWYGWPVIERPMGYLFETEVVDGKSIFTDIHLLGNPALTWLATLSMLVMLPFWVYNSVVVFRDGKVNPEYLLQSISLGGFIANFLPWAMVSRCIFLYHYIPASLFTLMSLSWMVSRLLSSTGVRMRMTGWVLIAIIVASFIYWLPIIVGIPISSEAFYSRMWFTRWI